MRNHKRQDRWDPDEVSKDQDNSTDALHNEHVSGKETQGTCLPFYLELVLMSPIHGQCGSLLHPMLMVS
jgi:hypothetical protein